MTDPEVIAQSLILVFFVKSFFSLLMNEKPVLKINFDHFEFVSQSIFQNVNQIHVTKTIHVANCFVSRLQGIFMSKNKLVHFTFLVSGSQMCFS